MGKSTTRTCTRKDKDGFERTAIVVDGHDDTDSLDVVDDKGSMLVRLNLFWDASKEHLIVDVIDVEERFQGRAALAFSQKKRRRIEVPKGGRLVSVDFRKTKEPKDPKRECPLCKKVRTLGKDPFGGLDCCKDCIRANKPAGKVRKP